MRQIERGGLKYSTMYNVYRDSHIVPTWIFINFVRAGHEIHTKALGGHTDIKIKGTILIHLWPFEKMPLLYFDYVKTADFGSEKKFLV